MGTHRGGIESWEDEERIEFLERKFGVINERMQNLDQIDRINKKLDRLVHWLKKRSSSSSDLKRSKKYKGTSRSCNRPKVAVEEEIEPWGFDFDDPFDTWGIGNEVETQGWAEKDFEEEVSCELQEGSPRYDSYADDEPAFEEESPRYGEEKDVIKLLPGTIDLGFDEDILNMEGQFVEFLQISVAHDYVGSLKTFPGEAAEINSQTAGEFEGGCYQNMAEFESLGVVREQPGKNQYEPMAVDSLAVTKFWAVNQVVGSKLTCPTFNETNSAERGRLRKYHFHFQECEDAHCKITGISEHSVPEVFLDIIPTCIATFKRGRPIPQVLILDDGSFLLKSEIAPSLDSGFINWVFAGNYIFDRGRNVVRPLSNVKIDVANYVFDRGKSLTTLFRDMESTLRTRSNSRGME
ncbi:hypothetical protein ACS0TY_014567 [Phlomoides rotata]